MEVQYTADGCHGTFSSGTHIWYVLLFSLLSGLVVLVASCAGYGTFGLIVGMPLGTIGITLMQRRRTSNFRVERGVLGVDGVELPLAGAVIRITHTTIEVDPPLGESLFLRFESHQQEEGRQLYEALQSVQQQRAGTVHDAPEVLRQRMTE